MSGHEIIEQCIKSLELQREDAKQHFAASHIYTQRQYWAGQRDAFTDAIATLDSLKGACQPHPS